ERRLHFSLRIDNKIHNWLSAKLCCEMRLVLIAERGTDRHPRRSAAWLKGQAAGVRSLTRLRHDAHIGLRRLPTVRIKLLGLVVGHGAGEDDFFTLLPI